MSTFLPPVSDSTRCVTARGTGSGSTRHVPQPTRWSITWSPTRLMSLVCAPARMSAIVSGANQFSTTPTWVVSTGFTTTRNYSMTRKPITTYYKTRRTTRTYCTFCCRKIELSVQPAEQQELTVQYAEQLKPTLWSAEQLEPSVRPVKQLQPTVFFAAQQIKTIVWHAEQLEPIVSSAADN